MQFTTPATGVSGFGDIRHLPVAHQMYPDRRCVLYTRSSGWAGAGVGKMTLEMKACAASAQIQVVTDVPYEEMYFAVEQGSVFARRVTLQLAAEHAARYGCLLVAPDWTRFVRPELYYRLSRAKGRNAARLAAQPTEEEYAKLRELTLGVQLATLLDPAATWQELHSAATKLRGTAGRPSGRDRY